MSKKNAKEFDDSAEATDFVETLYSMLHDKRLKNWMEVTDQNFLTNCSLPLEITIKQFDVLYNHFMNIE